MLLTDDEDSLECMCELLTTVGKHLDTETNERIKAMRANNTVVPGIMPLSEYFNQIQIIIQGKKPGVKISSRIKFMLEDVVELRNNDWKPRRETAVCIFPFCKRAYRLAGGDLLCSEVTRHRK